MHARHACGAAPPKELQDGKVLHVEEGAAGVRGRLCTLAVPGLQVQHVLRGPLGEARRVLRDPEDGLGEDRGGVKHEADALVVSGALHAAQPSHTAHTMLRHSPDRQKQKKTICCS